MPHGWSQTPDGLQVVVENLRPAGQHHPEGFLPFQKIRHQNFNHNPRIQFPHSFNRPPKMRRAAIRQIVSRHGGNDHMPEPQAPRGFGHPLRFVLFQRQRLGRFDRAKTAGPGAMIAPDHECRRGPAPAFPMVRALGAFANRVQIQFSQESAGAGKGRLGGQWQPQPVRQAAARGRGARGNCGR